ncbi:MAG: hypothetical protein M3O25_08910 [Actinomycetota bacterium]|nr:hypothetical protein [Actinomycetota bacterium]
MTGSRAIPIHVHGALEVLAAPLLLVAPFALGFSVPAGALSLAIAVLLVGLAASIYGGHGARGTLPLAAHAGFDYILAGAAIVLGLLVGFAAGDEIAALFMVAFGCAHLGLTASTRYSRPLGA